MPAWKIGLWISVAVVIVICGLVYLFLYLKTKQLRKKIAKDENQEILDAIIKQRGETLGEFPIALKEFFKDKNHDEDIEYMVNTCYRNYAKDVLIAGSDNEYLLATLLLMSQSEVYIDQNELNVSLWNSAVMKYPNLFIKSPNFNFNNKQFKLIFAFNQNIDNRTTYEKYIDYLENDGMLIIQQNKNNKNDAKLIKSVLKTHGQIFELSNIKGKYLYIVKKNSLKKQ